MPTVNDKALAIHAVLGGLIAACPIPIETVEVRRTTSGAVTGVIIVRPRRLMYPDAWLERFGFHVATTSDTPRTILKKHKSTVYPDTEVIVIVERPASAVMILQTVTP